MLNLIFVLKLAHKLIQIRASLKEFEKKNTKVKFLEREKEYSHNELNGSNSNSYYNNGSCVIPLALSSHLISLKLKIQQLQ